MTAMPDQSRLVDRAAELVAAARRAGADAADAVAFRRIGLSVDVRNGAVEETQRSESDELSLRVFIGQRHASISTNGLAAADELAERAVAMAKVAPEDRFAGLAPQDRLAKEFPDLDLLDETIPSPEQLVERARLAEAAALGVPGVSKSGGASAGWSLGGAVLATSHGFSGSYLGSRHSVSATAIAGEGTGMERDYDSDSKVHGSDLRDAASIGKVAAERAVRRLYPTRLPTGPVNVVFDPRVAVSLLGHLAGAVNGSTIVRKTSFLQRALGEQIFAPDIRITDDPHRIRGLASRPFDGEGVAAEPFDLVSEGVLRTWFLDSATARELGLETNGRAVGGGSNPHPSATNLTLLPGRQSPQELLAAIGDGLYVTELIGHGVNGVTGDYSRGAGGFRIVNGELAEAIGEITIAGNLRDMFRRLVAANDLEYRFAVNAPTVAIEGMTLAGR
ncbi:metallopeptidase TldD-related protein [Kaistia dalseonensis]|uniref:PmbA protein n=1 Tax=Kaistia dalseonensis TaxID=410840 RepID=A0ABU0HCF7_9HYPH|nr:metallopeptidase TldD-related protein [Kaistia dalseonensis]MCX5497361.1 metallopeptidase TldD-related protein [Kaistia dalseonensis]MDQ0439999.1 PmbA protein [Kaistia dalseonensis]